MPLPLLAEAPTPGLSPLNREHDSDVASHTAVIACGALVRELRALGVDASYLPAPLHSRPEQIPDAVTTAVRDAVAKAVERGSHLEHVVLGYGDCGTGGLLDAAIATLQTELGLRISRLPGDHCYGFLTGNESFNELHQDELGTFFLTDFLAQHFDLLVWRPLGLDRHPQLLADYFGHYRRLVYLVQTTDQERVAKLSAQAKDAADRLGLDLLIRQTGLAPLRSVLPSGSVSTPVTVSRSTSSAVPAFATSSSVPPDSE